MASPVKETCPVCHDDVEIFAVGSCDHVICYKCSTRMRVLFEQMYCVICRTDLSQVLFTRQAKKYEENVGTFKLSWQKQNIYFENERIQNAFQELISHKCKLCTCLKPMRNFHELEQHMRREHNLHYCDICVRHLKIFSAERKSYDREKLARHRRLGDVDDKSLKGHPLCELCDQRYLDRDELARHCRKEHFHCHFCETDGRSLEFFGDYTVLKDHFDDEHYLCEEGDCVNARFTNAFRSEIDLQAHRATSHSRSMKKAEARQARVLEVDFHLAPRPIHGRGRGRGRNRDRDYDRTCGDSRREDNNTEHLDREQRQNMARKRREEYQNAQAVALHLNEIHRQSGSIAMVDRAILDPKSLVEQVQPDTSTQNSNFKKKTEDFPTLDGKVNSNTVDSDDDRKRTKYDKDTLAKKLARASNFSVQDGSMEEQDFPSLGGRGRGKKSDAKSYKSAWQVQLESSDFPAMPSSQRAKKNTNSIFNTTKETAPVVINNNWVQSSQKPAASIKPKIPVDFNIGRVNSAPKLASQSTKAAPNPADFPSLSSIGNSLLNFTPNAPGLSLTRSSSAAALVSPSWSETGHGKPTGKSSTNRHTPPPNFVIDDFPSLGGSVSQSGKWIPKGKETVPARNNNTKANKKSKGKQPAPMPDFMQSDKPEPDPSEAEMKPPVKQNPKQEPWQTAKPQKGFRTMKEDKQTKELETMAIQQTKTKQQQGKKNKEKKSQNGSVSRNTPDISDKESDPEETKAETKSKKTANKGKKGAVSKDTTTKYTAEPPRQSDKEQTTKDRIKNYNVDPPKEPEKNSKPSKVDSPKESKKDLTHNKMDTTKQSKKAKTNNKVNLPKESSQDIASYKVDPPKESKRDLASYKVDSPKQSKKNKTNCKVGSPKEPEKLVVKAPDPVPVSLEKQALQPKVENFPSLSELSQTGSIIQSLSLNADEFPVLGSMKSPALGSNTKSAKPPPGFTCAVDKTTTKPPPGFVNPVSSASTSKPPPGFSSPRVNNNIENVAPLINGNVPPPSYTYMQATNFKQRNQQLISDIQGMLSSEQFSRFKSCSGEYRQDVISASEYYNKCSDIMGGDRFAVIFPQLLSLLPDINKQQELLTAHTTLEDRSRDIIAISKSGKRGWNQNVSLFTTCATCRQVVLHTELSAHMSQHSTDTDFPTLSSIGASLGKWPKI